MPHEDKGDLVFTARDANLAYEFVFRWLVGPFLVLDESFRTTDDRSAETIPGRTLMVVDSDSSRLFAKLEMINRALDIE